MIAAKAVKAQADVLGVFEAAAVRCQAGACPVVLVELVVFADSVAVA